MLCTIQLWWYQWKLPSSMGLLLIYIIITWQRDTWKEDLAGTNGSTLFRADINRTHCMFSFKCIIEGERLFYKKILLIFQRFSWIQGSINSTVTVKNWGRWKWTILHDPLHMHVTGVKYIWVLRTATEKINRTSIVT